MRENVGSWDRSMRAVAGPLLIGWGYRHRHSLAGIAAIAGGAAITETAITRVCPMNTALGINTASGHSDTATQPDLDHVDEMVAAAASLAAAQPLPTID